MAIKRKTLKIITWNCNMAFRKKARLILKHKPDILIIQECEALENIIFDEITTLTDKFWYGENRNKGLGVFSFSGYKIKPLNCHNPNFKTIVPLRVTGEINFNLFAVWAKKNPDDPKCNYLGQVWKAIHFYKKLLSEPSMLIGDFNGWNLDGSITKDSDESIVSFLLKRNINSAYHAFFGNEYGQEKHATHYWHKNRDRKFHIDYCFASDSFIPEKVEIGTRREWIKHSDHTPLIVTMKLVP